MTVIGLIGIFAGYAVASYGIVLVRGYDITWRQWIDPVHPWTWPKGKVPEVPPTRYLPG